MEIDNIVANKDNNIQGQSNLDILLFMRDVSSCKNSADRKVTRQDIIPRKWFFKPKKTIV